MSRRPILIVHSAADQTVLPERSEALAARVCAMGQVVERVVHNDGSSHVASTIPAYFMAFDWVQARLAGIPVMSTC